MSKNDIWFFGFITIWVVTCAGQPDILDGLTQRLMKDSCQVEDK